MPPTKIPKVNDFLIGRGAEAPSERESANQADRSASWFHRHITDMPKEVLSLIFNCLGPDDITQVKDTCRVFREVVQERHREIFFYCQLPQRFRNQFPHSLPWLKQLVKNGLHPFATTLPSKENDVLDEEQKSAIVCFHTLGKMMATCEYRPVNVVSRVCDESHRTKFHFSPASSNLLINNRSGQICLYDQSNSWSAQVITRRENVCLWMCHGASFSNDARYLSTFSSRGLIEIYRRDGDGWKLFNDQNVETASSFELSPSGKYLIVENMDCGVERIMCFDDAGYWKSMPMAEDVRIYPTHHSVHFSSSEQHMAISYSDKVVILSLDSQGCWVSFREIGSDNGISYSRLCPFGRWLLIADSGRFQCGGFIEVVRLDRTSEFRQKIADEYFNVNFSPSGNYLATGRRAEKYRLWRLDKSGCWVLHSSLTSLIGLRSLISTSPWPFINTNTFSPCDNYLFSTYSDGAVEIRGKDKQGSWTVRGSLKNCGTVISPVKYSCSGVHALMVVQGAIHIWGRNEAGLWSVKGTIPATTVYEANFHPAAEHLVVYTDKTGLQIWEMRTLNT